MVSFFSVICVCALKKVRKKAGNGIKMAGKIKRKVFEIAVSTNKPFL